MNEQKITMLLSVEQAIAVKHALNLLVRLGIGDLTSAVIGSLQDRTIPSTNNADDIDDVDYALSNAINGVVLPNCGIGNSNVDIKVKRAYEVNKALSKAIVSCTGKGRGTVDNDGLSEYCRYTDDLSPIVGITQESH